MDEFIKTLDWSKFIIPIVIFILCLLVGMIIQNYLIKIIKKFTKKTETGFADTIISILKRPLIFWFTILGLMLSSQMLDLNEKAKSIVETISTIILVISIVMVLSKLTVELVNYYYKKRNQIIQATSIISNIIRVIFFIIGLSFVLNILGYSLTPIITALGIGGLAVALALQDTLSNLFSGLYITVSKQVRAGDYIQLENGSEGFVHDTGWRSTTLLLPSNNYIIIPNTKLAQSIITNYSLPNTKTFVSLGIKVDHNVDIEKVEEIIMDEFQKVSQNIVGIEIDPAPVLAFSPGIQEYYIEYSLGFFVSKYADRAPILNAARKAIYIRLTKENIRFYPIKTINLKDK
jgi:small-conductance mechanosensitive channel